MNAFFQFFYLNCQLQCLPTHNQTLTSFIVNGKTWKCVLYCIFHLIITSANKLWKNKSLFFFFLFTKTYDTYLHPDYLIFYCWHLLVCTMFVYTKYNLYSAVLLFYSTQNFEHQYLKKRCLLNHVEFNRWINLIMFVSCISLSNRCDFIVL